MITFILIIVCLYMIKENRKYRHKAQEYLEELNQLKMRADLIDYVKR